MKSALLCLLVTLYPLGSAMALDLDLYAKILEERTRETGDLPGVRVDYAGLRQDARWPALIRSLESSDPATLTSRQEQIAFWTNAYNVLAIDLVVRHTPEESIKDIGSLFSPVWKKPAGRIGGRRYSLDEIEHEIVRPLGDPRTHAGLICASKSCPPLLREPWRPEALDEQLERQVRVWLAHTDKGLRVDRKRKTLYLSSIFDWFEEDFEARGGVVDFAIAYAPAELSAWIREQRSDLRVRYLDYDWSLNAL